MPTHFDVLDLTYLYTCRERVSSRGSDRRHAKFRYEACAIAPGRPRAARAPDRGDATSCASRASGDAQAKPANGLRRIPEPISVGYLIRAAADHRSRRMGDIREPPRAIRAEAVCRQVQSHDAHMR